MKESAYKKYLLTILFAILASYYVERLALGLLLQDIKVDLELSDTQLALLSGVGYTLLYAVMGIPIARWADRGNRVTIITLAAALWSTAAAMCGLAGSFLQLLLIRIGVTVGEAGCIPPAHSLIADHFSRVERPRAVARYMLGGPLSAVVGYFLAGWLNGLYGWRVTFVLLSLPGLALAALAWVTLREPRVGRSLPEATGSAASTLLTSQHEEAALSPAYPSLKEVCVTLWANTTFRHLLFCFSVVYFFGYGILQWKPAFFVRSYGLETGDVATWFAIINGVGGFIGVYCGGEIASRRASLNERLQLRAMAVVYASFGIISAGIYLSPNLYVAFGLMGLATVGGHSVAGPLFATLQTVVPPRMRAMSIAIIFLVANFIGTGLGPLAAGALSDAMRPFAGEESLRYALLVLCPGYVWGAWHLLMGSRTVARDLSAVQVDHRAAARDERGVVDGATGFDGMRADTSPSK